jgi:dTMP kinase
MPDGKFIVFEGIDGSGTTVQAQLLHGRLNDLGVSCHKTAEPSGGAIGRLMGQILGDKPKFTYLNHLDHERRKVILALLFTADRMDHAWTEMETYWNRGDVVLCDRYAISTLAYELGVLADREWIDEIGRAAPLPDLTIYLRLSAEQAFERLQKRWEEKGAGGASPEIFEKLELQKQLVSNYDAFCGCLYEGEHVVRRHNVVTVDASGTIEEVHEKVWGVVGEHLRQWSLLND